MSLQARTCQLIVVEVKDGQLGELPNLRRDGTCRRIFCTNQRVVDSFTNVAIKRERKDAIGHNVAGRGIHNIHSIRHTTNALSSKLQFRYSQVHRRSSPLRYCPNKVNAINAPVS